MNEVVWKDLFSQWSEDISKGVWEHLASSELTLSAVGAGKGRGRGETWMIDVPLDEMGMELDGIEVREPSSDQIWYLSRLRCYSHGNEHLRLSLV